MITTTRKSLMILKLLLLVAILANEKFFNTASRKISRKFSECCFSTQHFI